MSALEKSLLRSKLPPIAPLSMSSSSRHGFGKKRDYTPVHWSKYFEDYAEVTVGSNTFRAYQKGNTGPALVLLHGGGFSALTWSLFTEHVTSLVVCQVLAIDLRGHGDTQTTDEEDMSADVLSRDVGHVVESVFGQDAPPTILVGHSMGGAVAVHVAHEDLLPSLIGLAVIDVVEGTAMDALASMQSFLRSRPKVFHSIPHAIEWCVRSGQVRNLESARVSMPGQIKNCETGKTATYEVSPDGNTTATSPDIPVPPAHINSNTILEEEEDASSSDFKAPTPPACNAIQAKYGWRIDLAKTESYWTGWFQGLSLKFLECSVPKMLLLAGIDRLDKELTIGQMQGKFQMQVIPQSGHAVHEDVPDKVADIIANFMVKHKVAEPTCNFQSILPAC